MNDNITLIGITLLIISFILIMSSANILTYVLKNPEANSALRLNIGLALVMFGFAFIIIGTQMLSEQDVCELTEEPDETNETNERDQRSATTTNETDY